MDGVIVIDKPSGWTSHDIVNKVRRIAGTKRIGHLGTLDPAATGVLPLVIGRATRLAQFYTKNEKIYEGVIRFGYSTDTYDAAGVATSPEQPVTLDAAQITELLEKFKGPQKQTPPPVSAKKIGGKAAYELARKNLPVDLQPVDIEIHALDILALFPSEISVRIHCSSGTYIRSIAHDLGNALGCGAHLKSLRRTASGDFTLDKSRTLEDLQTLASENRLEESLIPASEMLPNFPAETVDQITTAQIRNGRDFRTSPFRTSTSRYVKAITSTGELIAIGEARLPNLYHPVLVL